MKTIRVITFLIIVVSVGIGICLYPQIPDKFVSHWNIQGQPDGYMPKFWGLFLMPIISFIMFLLFLLIPKIDPLKENVAQFRKYFDNFILVIMLFMFYLNFLAIRWNQGARFDFIQFLTPAFAILFYYAGVLTGHAKKNWFIGIRTPWTMHSESVWDKTHKLGGKLFKITAVTSLFGLIFPSAAFYFLIVPAILAAIYSTGYSYFEYKKEIK